MLSQIPRAAAVIALSRALLLLPVLVLTQGLPLAYPVCCQYGADAKFLAMTAFDSVLGLAAHASAPTYETVYVYGGEWTHQIA
jgi:hypothetical protein